MLEGIFQKIDDRIPLNEEDALELLEIPTGTEQCGKLVQKAAEISRRDFGNKGYIFTQIGLNVAPCSGNCSFCSLAQCNSTFTESYEKPIEDLLNEIATIDFTRVTAVFLMTTADFDQDKFLEYGRAVKNAIPPEIALVANTGDFDVDYAYEMKQAGFTGVYHIVRLREGIDTGISTETRVASLDAAEAAGLRIYYCLEPIGPEHSYREMVTEMLRARRYRVDVMAAMRRVSVDRTGFQGRDMINDEEFQKIAAVTRLVVMPRVSMNVHEPNRTAMEAGINQLYAELGANPRDSEKETQGSRGLPEETVAQMLQEKGYIPCIEQKEDRKSV